MDYGNWNFIDRTLIRPWDPPGHTCQPLSACQVNDRVLVLGRLLLGHFQDFRHDGVEGAQPGLGLSVVEVEGAGGVSWVQDPNPLPLVFLQIQKMLNPNLIIFISYRYQFTPK